MSCRFLGEEQRHVQCGLIAAGDALQQQVPEAAVCRGHRHGLGDTQARAHAVNTVQEILRRSHEDT